MLPLDHLGLSTDPWRSGISFDLSRALDWILLRIAMSVSRKSCLVVLVVLLAAIHCLNFGRQGLLWRDKMIVIASLH